MRSTVTCLVTWGRAEEYRISITWPGSQTTLQSHLEAAVKVCFGNQWRNGLCLEKKIMHRDLAARNVLVREEKVCKITDFGMARDFQEKGIYVRSHEGSFIGKRSLHNSQWYVELWSAIVRDIHSWWWPLTWSLHEGYSRLAESGYRMSRPNFTTSWLSTGKTIPQTEKVGSLCAVVKLLRISSRIDL